MTTLSSVARIASLNHRNTARLLASAILCAFVLVGTSTLAGAAQSKASSAKISAHLTKKSFTNVQAKKVKLIYKFSAPSRTFAYRLSFKKGSKWRTVKSVKRKGTFKGSHKMTVKKVFAGKPVKLGRYRLRLSADGGSKLLSFKVVKGRKPANTALPTISGTATQGQKLTASKGSWSNSPTSYAYQWRRCNSAGASCSGIAGATSSSYTLVPIDTGSTIRVVVTAKNAYGSTSATSRQTAIVKGLPPANTALPTISGTATQGQTLTASNGSWSNSPTSYAYQWRRCDSSGASCADISGASAGSYTLASADIVGSTVRVVVTASNSYGSASATSTQTTVVATVLAISGGYYHTCALSSAGTLKCWGANWDGQLGNGTTTQSSTPVQVKDAAGTGTLLNVTQISAGGSHTCALLADHTVECWGYNNNGQLGNGTTTDSSTPVQVKDAAGTGTLSNVTQISAGDYHTCALQTSGAVECWGFNDEGELGDSTTTGSSTPVQVKGAGGKGTLSTVTQISAGGSHTCALLSGGTVECWGYNDDGELGDGATTDSSIPVQVKDVAGTGTLSNVTQISAGDYHTCALLPGGAVECWGDNSYGRLGDGTTVPSSIPVEVKGAGGTGTLSNVTQISAGGPYTCALLSGGTVECWGYNAEGELGDGTTADRSTPVPVAGAGGTGTLSNVTQISAGGSHTCALLSGGTVECWGYNDDGELGDGTTADRSTPAQVKGVGGAGVLSNVTQISAGGSHTCALLADHTVECWGDNRNGRLGNGTTTQSSTPVQVKDVAGTGTLSNVTQIIAGYSHTCALLTGGTVECWGYNPQGQLGNGTTTDSSIPVQVKDVAGTGTLSNVTQIIAGYYHTCALLSGGTVECWGYNGYGRLGNGTTTPSSIPVEVKGVGGVGTLSNVAQISAGGSHTCALLTDNTVECWGYNYYGQLGNDTTADSSTPVEVKGVGGVGTLSNAAQINAGYYHTCALLSDNSVDCWGYNHYGQLGDGTTTQRLTPVQVKDVAAVGTLSNVTQISAGSYHTCVLSSGGTVKCWGANWDSQLGNGTTTDSATPVEVEGVGGVGVLSNVTQIGAGYYHTCALLTDHTVECWGYNYNGQLGNGEIGYRTTPVSVISIP